MHVDASYVSPLFGDGFYFVSALSFWGIKFRVVEPSFADEDSFPTNDGSERVVLYSVCRCMHL